MVGLAPARPIAIVGSPQWRRLARNAGMGQIRQRSGGYPGNADSTWIVAQIWLAL